MDAVLGAVCSQKSSRRALCTLIVFATPIDSETGACGTYLSELLCGGNACWYAITPLVMISSSLTSSDLDMVKKAELRSV
jgi:hypothetical protein